MAERVFDPGKTTMGNSGSRLAAVPKPIKGRSVVKQGFSKGGTVYPEAIKANRHGNLEPEGFKGAPQMTVNYPNAPEASETYRNVRILPSKAGFSDFNYRRQYGQTF